MKEESDKSLKKVSMKNEQKNRANNFKIVPLLLGLLDIFLLNYAYFVSKIYLKFSKII
jgi:hypothetical protein